MLKLKTLNTGEASGSIRSLREKTGSDTELLRVSNEQAIPPTLPASPSVASEAQRLCKILKQRLSNLYFDFVKGKRMT